MRRAVGIFFFLGLALLAGLSLWVDDESKLFQPPGTYYYISLPGAAGLEDGAPVWVAGMAAGRVTRVELRDGEKNGDGEKDLGVRIHFTLDEGFSLREDSVASLQSTSLLSSGRTLTLTLGSPESPKLVGKPAMPGERVSNVRPVASLDGLVAKADNMFASLEAAGPAIREAAESIRNIAAKIEEGQGTLGKLVNDPKLYDDLVGAVAKLDDGLATFKKIATKMDEGEGTLGKLLNDPKLYDELTGAVEKLDEGMDSFRKIAAKIEKGEGTIGKLVNDEALYTDLRDASQGIAELSRKLNSGEGTLGKLISDPALYDELKTAASSLAAVMRKIDEGQGSLGRLVNDETLYEEAVGFLKGAREAVEDAREQAPISAFSSVIFAAFQ